MEILEQVSGGLRPPTWINDVQRAIRLSMDSISRLHRDGLIRPAEPTTDATGADPNRTDGLALWAGRRDRTIPGARWRNERHAEQGYMGLRQYRELLNEAGLPGDNEAFLSRVIDDGSRDGRLLNDKWPLVGVPLTAKSPPPADRQFPWQQVQERLQRLCALGESYVSQRQLADRMACSGSTVHKAISASPELTKWMVEARPRTPRAVPFNEVVTDNTRQATETDPSDVMPDDDVDTLMAKLIEQAEPKERARLNELTDEQRRNLAKAYSEQKRDAEPSPLQEDLADRPPRNAKQFGRV